MIWTPDTSARQWEISNIKKYGSISTMGAPFFLVVT